MKNKKENILKAWIMVEHLSEGDISLKDRNCKRIELSEEEDYFSFFMGEINKKKLKPNQKGGIVLYFNIFEFEEAVNLLRKNFNPGQIDEDLRLGHKFSFALYFDNNLRLARDMTFFTASSYILNTSFVPSEKKFLKFENDFLKYEEENKNNISQIFDSSEDEDYPKFFNEAFAKLMDEYSVKIDKCRMKALNNLGSDATNLHSFFISDLQKAKEISTGNLNKYLEGSTEGSESVYTRVDLNSRKDHKNFNPQIFKDILKPINYPNSRFPSNPDHSLYLMQQVAVNLSIGYDDTQSMRSVNGPPGTGKTTLLKDIFSELVVEQAYEIAKLKSKTIADGLTYFKNGKIGILPISIADKGIVVASSNNGAVQNIVKELPLISEIDEKFIEELKEADYFWGISNPKVSAKWEKGPGDKIQEVPEVPNEEEKYWGLFSLEGGRKSNMDHIIKSLDFVFQHLDKDYIPKPDIYDEFLAAYKSALDHKNCIQVIAEKAEIVQELKLCDKRIEDLRHNQIESINESVEALKLQKPCFFEFKKNKEYRREMRVLSDQLISLLEEEGKLKKRKAALMADRDRINKDLNNLKAKANDIKINKENNINFLNMCEPYDQLHKSNPWFDKKYRIMQSRLFILALKIRKQFLYENKRSIRAAYNIWKNQNEYIGNKELILQAWNWTNLTIPVISSTFASFSRMFKYLDKECIGYLFVDEAGQALPQASVGAIFRSKKVMVVGDPAQIKPVLTLDSQILGNLGKCYNVSAKYLSENASTQTLVDDIGKYGFYKNEEDWIGIPLWVHRRCKNPMFNISNEISYDGNMVQSTDIPGKGFWYNVSGHADDKYVKKQGDKLKEIISKLIDENPKINDKNKKDTIYVISPFRNVAYQLSTELAYIGFTRYSPAGRPTNVGTVHTFQGKEAPIVFLVLGCDEKSKGAASWAVGTANPNIMNVAATRAKDEFYIIGDQELFLNLGSDVIEKTYNVLVEFNS